MRTALADTDVRVVIPFRRNGEPFLPDANSVTYEVRGQDGSVVSSGNLTPGAAETFAVVVVPAALNAITSDFEKRAVLVRCTNNNEPFDFTTRYRLVGWLNHSVSVDEVRRFIGVDAGELPDKDIDIPSAYFNFQARVTASQLTAALESGDINEQRANEGIIAQAVLDLLPALSQRLSVSESDGAASAEREKIDLLGLAGKARDKISEAVTAVSGRAQPSFNPITFGGRTDIFEA